MSWWGCEHKCCHELSEAIVKLAHEVEEIEENQEKILALLEQLLVPEAVDSFFIMGETMNINQGQSVNLTAVPLGASGNPTKLPAGDVPAWATSDASAVDVTPSADGLTLAVLVHADAPAEDITFQITDGQIPTATGTFVLTVQAPAGAEPVASFAVTADTPVDVRPGPTPTTAARTAVRR